MAIELKKLKRTTETQQNTTPDNSSGNSSTIQLSSLKKATTNNDDFYFGSNINRNNKYVKRSDGSYVKVQATPTLSDKDARSIARTGHKTFGTDISNALSGGGNTWAANQLSTLATIGLAGKAIANGDNNYQPEKGSTLWKMLNASSADTRVANQMLESSKEGRSKFAGGLVMDVASQAVMNGIDAAIKSISGPLGTISFASRSFGGSAQQARDEGKGVTTQIVTGAVSAAIETITENMWQYGGVRDYTGKYLPDSGKLGRLTSRLEAAIAEKAGPVVSKIAMSFGTEAIEEMLADILNPVASAAIRGISSDDGLLGDYEGERWQGIGNMIYDGLVGGLSGVGGGVVDSISSVGEFKSEYGGNKALYAADIRNQVQQQLNEQRDATGLRNASILDSLDRLFNKKTGQTLSERASAAAGTYVSTKRAYKMLAEVDADVQRIAQQVAKQFADSSFANEVVDKSILEKAAYNFIINGEFSDSLESVDGARDELKALTSEILKAEAEQKLSEAKSKKDKAGAAFYSSLLSDRFNARFTEESSVFDNDVDNITEARTYQYGEEDLVDNVDNAEEEEIARPVPQKPKTESKSQQEVNAMSPQERAKWMLDSGSDTIRLEGDPTGKTYSAEAKALFDAISEEAKSRGLKAELVYNEQSNQWEAKLTQDESAKAEQANQEQQSEEAEPTLTKSDKQKINRLFQGKQQSVKIASDSHGNVLLEAIRQKAQENGREVVVDKGKVRLTETQEGVANEQDALAKQSEKIKAISERLGVPLSDEESTATVKRFASNSNGFYSQKQNRPLSKTLELVLSGNAKTLNGSELNDAFKYVLEKAGLNRNSKYLLDDISDFIFGNFEQQTSQQVFYKDRQEGEDYLTKQEVDALLEAENNDTKADVPLTNLQLALFKLIDEFNSRRFDINKYFQSSKDVDHKATMYFAYDGQQRDDVTAKTTFDAILNGERTATTREARWKGHDQWQRTKVGDTISFSENKDGTGRKVTVKVDGKYTVKARIDDDTVRVADDYGNTFKLSRSQWSKKEGWAETSKWFSELSPGDIWITYEMVNPGESASGDSDVDANDVLDEEYTSDDSTGEIIKTLHESYGEDFPTENAVNLRSSLMSGFAPSDKFGVGDLSVSERLSILRQAFPDEDFSISHYNENEIVDSSAIGEDEETQNEERRWNRRNLKAEVYNEAKNAYGTLKADPNTTSFGGRDVAGWVDTGKANEENISVSEKQTALNRINRSNKAKERIKSIDNRISAIKKAVANIRAVLEARKNRLVDYTKNEISAVDATREQLYSMLEDLDAFSRYGYVSSSPQAQKTLSRINYEKAALVVALKEIRRTDASKLYDDDLNAYLTERLNVLESESRALADEIKEQQQLVAEASYRETQRNAIKETWIDQLSEQRLKDLLFDQNNNQYYGNLILSKEELSYARRLYRENYERDNPTEKPIPQKLKNAGIGKEVGVAYNIMEEGIYGTSQNNESPEDRVERQANRRHGERGTPFEPLPGDIRPSQPANRFNIGAGKNGRIAYNNSDYISIYDDRDGGKQVGKILPKNKTVGGEFDRVREYLGKNKRVKKVIFSRGYIYDSARGQLCNGIKVEYANGDIVIILSADNDEDYYKAAVHENTHINIDAERNRGNALLARNALVVSLNNLFGGVDTFREVVSAVVENGGYKEANGSYDALEVFDEILANINAGISAYGVDFGAYADKLKKTNLYNIISDVTDADNGTPGIKRMASQSASDRQAQEREEQNEAYAEAERQAMSDEELWQLRRQDLDTPTLQDFERAKREQPNATKKMSAKEANEIANLSFGEKGRVRATRVVERFPTNFKMFSKALSEKQASVLNDGLGKMRKALIDVNDGYGTVKDVSDFYRTWRDNKLLADYWNEDVQARFDKILEDAESRGWEFNPQEQREFAQAYEEAGNAMIARINNINKDTDRMAKLKADAIANKRGWKSDGLLAKAAQKWIRMQATTDTALKFFGGFKGSGAFYDLSKDIKDSVAKRMVTFVDAYSHFDALKQMEGFKEFADNKKTYKVEFNGNFAHHKNPLAGHEFTLQQIVTMNRLFKTLDKTFEHSDAKAAERIKGFVFRDAKGNSFTVDLGDFSEDSDTKAAMKQTSTLAAIQTACMDILSRDGAVFDVARAYDKAADAMFKKMGKQVSDVKKRLTGNTLSLIGEDYTPVLWANEDGTPADFNFNDDDRIKPPSFLYNRTAKQGYLVVSDISYIVDKYIEKAADYVGTAQIKDTLARMNDGTSLLDNGKGLNSALAENFGKEAGSWFDEYVKDLTEYGENDSIWAALRRNMQKGALIGSPSVMMKQTSSYWSAMGLLSPEALAMAYRWKIGVKAADNSEYNKLLKYRNISDKFDPTLSEIIQDVSKYGNISNSRVFKLFVNGISAQDYKTVDNLYTATMIDTYLSNQNKDAEYFTSGEFQSDIDSKFTEVMMRSQPMFDTELRAEYARTDNELVKMTSMFRTQQTQNLNLIATAIGEYNASKGTGNQAEKLKVLQQTVAGQASAALSLALLSVAADFMLHGLKKYRGDGDDEDEEPGDGKIELGRILGRIGLNAVETGAGTAWFGDSVAKWLIDRMSGGETNEFYSFNMGPLSTMKSVIDNLEYAAKSPTPSNIKNVATNVAQLLGIPLNNAYRYVNSAVMYAHTLTGNNDKKYDDMLKMWGGAAKVADKNIKGRNLLVESGMSKKEANAFVRLVDEDGNGLNKDDLTNWYVDHPEDGDKVSILWDSMGWKQTFAKAKKSLDKKVVYNSNPLFAEMDEDESESVSKTELMNYYIDHPEIRDDLEKMYTDLGFKDFKSAVKSTDKKIKFRSNPLYAEMDEDENESVSKTELTEYAIEHPEMYDNLAPLYKELGFKGTFRSAIRSAESTKIKEAAEDAFYDGDYNALFESVSQMKNGKTWLTNMVKDEYPDYENMENPLLHYLTDSGLSTKQVDSAVESFGGKKLVPQYKKLRESGLSPKQSVERLDLFDSNDNGSITQTELADYYKAHPEEEAIIAEFWSACGWSKTWAQYKKSKKLK